jgi:hypothetical protein
MSRSESGRPVGRPYTSNRQQRIENRPVFERLKQFMAAKRKKRPPAPNVTARISRDESSTMLNSFRGYAGDMNWMAAKYPFEWIELIDTLYRFDPNLKKHLLTTISLGNSGHDIEIDSPTDARAQAAMDVCNSFAARCFPFAGGYDGAANGLFSQAARNGGICVEFVPDEKGTRIERLYLVPIRTLRFRRIESGEIELGQIQDGHFTPLNPIQTSYHSVWFEDSNPYPIPPALAALGRLSGHKRIMSSVEAWFSKLSSMGFLSINFERPEYTGESEAEYRAKCGQHLNEMSSVVKDNLTSGIVVGFDDMKAVFQNTSAGAGGAAAVAQMVDEDMFAGLGRDPVMFGRSFSRTETWSRVAYEELTREIWNIQLAVKRTLEHGHRLNLALNGFGDCGVKIEFKAMRSLDEFRDAEAERMRGDGIRADYAAGIIDLATARDRLGYEEQSAESGAFVASVSAEAGSIGAGGMYAAHTKRRMIRNSGVQGPPKLLAAARDYLDEIRRMLSEAGQAGIDAVNDWALMHDVPNVDEFVAEALREFQIGAESAISETRLIEIARTHISAVVLAAKNNPVLWGPASPRSAGIGVDFSMPDREAIKYMERVDKFYVSKYVSNSPQRSNQIANWLENQYLEKGLGIGKNKKQLQKFRDEFGAVSERLGDHAARVIIDTGVMRANNWSSILALSEEGFARFRIAGPVDNVCCRYCAAMVGRTFDVAIEKKRIEDVISSGDEDISKFDPFLTSRYGTKAGIAALKQSSNDRVQASGMVTPPFHPMCRHTIVAQID